MKNNFSTAIRGWIDNELLEVFNMVVYKTSDTMSETMGNDRPGALLSFWWADIHLFFQMAISQVALKYGSKVPQYSIWNIFLSFHLSFLIWDPMGFCHGSWQGHLRGLLRLPETEQNVLLSFNKYTYLSMGLSSSWGGNGRHSGRLILSLS